MLRRASPIIAAIVSCVLRSAPVSAGSFIDDFTTDPFGAWSIASGPGPGFADNSNGQIAYDAAGGELDVHDNSALSTVRLHRQLGRAYTPDDAFKFSAQLRLDSVIASADEFMQICFALTNSATTGAVRAGPMISAANTFDNLELAYYPNPSCFGGPFVTLTVQGSAQGAAHAFAHFNFVSAEATLPVGQVLEWRGAYTPSDRRVHFRIPGYADLSLSLDEAFAGFAPPSTFTVDRFAITSYFDGADWTPGSVSLIADVAYLSAAFIVTGDADDDDDIDLADWSAAQTCFGSSLDAAPACDAFDADDNGQVELADFASLALVVTGP